MRIANKVSMKQNNVSKLTRNQNHAKERKAWLAGQWCSVCRRHRATEIHHIAGRNAAAKDAIAVLYEDPRNWLAVCGAFAGNCHDRIDKQVPALLACAAKMRLNELDIKFLRTLKPGRRFAFTLDQLHQALDDLDQW